MGKSKNILFLFTNFCTGTATSDCSFPPWKSATSWKVSDNLSRELVNGVAEKDFYLGASYLGLTTEKEKYVGFFFIIFLKQSEFS